MRKCLSSLYAISEGAMAVLVQMVQVYTVQPNVEDVGFQSVVCVEIGC